MKIKNYENKTLACEGLTLTAWMDSQAHISENLATTLRSLTCAKKCRLLCFRLLSILSYITKHSIVDERSMQEISAPNNYFCSFVDSQTNSLLSKPIIARAVGGGAYMRV